MRISSVLFCDFPPRLSWVQGTLLNCYPKISSLAASLTRRKILFSNFVKGSFPLGLRKWNHRRLHILACIFFSCLLVGMRSWSEACERLYLLTLSPQFGPILRWDPAVMISKSVHTDSQENPGSLGTGIQTECWFITENIYQVLPGSIWNVYCKCIWNKAFCGCSCSFCSFASFLPHKSVSVKGQSVHW